MKITSRGLFHFMTNAKELEFWASRYRESRTPWDKGAAHPELLARLDEGAKELAVPPKSGRALVPGCGRGWDALALAERGWEVFAVDMVEALKPQLQPAIEDVGGKFEVADALTLDEGPFDLIFDHTFFCAIPPERRHDWGRMVHRNLAAGGYLISLVFPFNRPEEEGGPPWKMASEDICKSLGDKDFDLLEDVKVRAPSSDRAWEERWVVLHKKLLSKALL